MATVKWGVPKDNAEFTNNAIPLINSVNGREWTHFFEALGKVEGRNSYNTVNDSGYIGIYQFAPFSNKYAIFKDVDFSNNIGGMLDATTDAKYLTNPIAQELSAIMEFSGIPDITKTFSSKYKYVRDAAPGEGLSQSQFDSMIGQTYTIQWVDGNNQPIEGAVQTFKITSAGISAAAHLIGQAGVAEAMAKIYTQTEEGRSTVLLSINGGNHSFADGSGIAFSTYIQLYQAFDVSPLIVDAADGLTQFNQFAQELITYRKDKIIDYLINNNQETAMSVSYGGTDYRKTVRAIMVGLSLPTDNLNAVDGQVVLAGAASNTKYTNKADLIFGLGNASNTLDGGVGADIMIGGDGNDTYKVDDSNDKIVEKDGEGKDLVQSIADNYTLPDNVENLTLMGTAHISGTGNGLDNVIIGNAGNNLLVGGGGDDIFLSGGGNDTLAGGSGNDRLDGGPDNDMLFGRGGNDTFIGGTGFDSYYVYNRAGGAQTVYNRNAVALIDDEDKKGAVFTETNQLNGKWQNIIPADFGNLGRTA